MFFTSFFVAGGEGPPPPHLVLSFQADGSCPPGDSQARLCIAYVELNVFKGVGIFISLAIHSCCFRESYLRLEGALGTDVTSSSSSRSSCAARGAVPGDQHKPAPSQKPSRGRGPRYSH